MRGHQNHTQRMEQIADHPPTFALECDVHSKARNYGKCSGALKHFFNFLLCFGKFLLYLKHPSLQNPKVSILNFDDRLRISDGQNTLLPHVVT